MHRTPIHGAAQGDLENQIPPVGNFQLQNTMNSNGDNANPQNTNQPIGGAAARGPLEEFCMEYVNMDPRFMEEDEIDYELRARRLFDENMRRLERKRVLTRCLQREGADNEIIAESPIAFEEDNKECREKIKEISRFLGLQRKKRLDFYRVGSQLAHVEMRVQRMHATTEQERETLENLRSMVQNALDVFLEVVSTYMEGEANEAAGAQDNRQVRPIEVAQLEDQLRQTLLNPQQGPVGVRREGTADIWRGNPVEIARQPEAFIPGQLLNPEEYFGQYEHPPLPFSSTVNSGQAQPGPSWAFSQSHSRPSTVRGSIHQGNDNNQRRVSFAVFPNAGEVQDGLPPVANNRVVNGTYDVQNPPGQNANYPVHASQNNLPGRGAYGDNKQKTVPIHRWHIRFSGEEKSVSNKDLKLNEFLYLLHVQKTAQRISDGELLAQIHWLLTDSAKTWYFSCYDRFHDWPNFVERIRERFLSPDHAVEAWHEITTRVQQKTESARTFLSKMVMSFRSLPTLIDERTQVAVIRRGLLPETRNIIGPWNVRTIAELEYILARIQPTKSVEKRGETRNAYPGRTYPRRAVEALERESTDSEGEMDLTEEEICVIQKYREDKKRKTREERSKTSKKSENQPKDAEVVDSRNEEVKCHNCGEKGHLFRNCKKPRRGIFCYKCGKSEVTAKECSCQSKNGLDCLDRILTETSSDSDD